MIEIILGIVTTILAGPIMFYILSHTLYSNLKVKKYPAGIIDGIGDLIFLPLFNGFFFAVVSFNLFVFFISLVIAIIFTLICVYYQKDIAPYLDWSKPKQGKFNFGGWYHSAFMLIQSFVIFYGLISSYKNIFLWISFAGYMTIVLIQIFKEGYF